MMKLLLIQPPTHPESLVFGYMNPYALEILAAGIIESFSNVDVEIIDLRVEKGRNGWERIKSFKPDIVGVTGITIDYPMMLKVLEYVKNISQNITTIVGGHHATIAPSDFYKPTVDIIIHGPGIESLKEIILKYDEKDFGSIKGITYQKGENIFHTNPPRNDFSEVRRWPLPAYHLTEKYSKHYIAFSKRYRVITTAMGCPFRCSFCACWKAFSGKYITRSPEDVVREIINAKEKYIFFGDDLTFGDINRARRIAELIQRAGIRKKYNGYCRADIIVKNPEIFSLWKNVGLFGLTVGMEALSDNELLAFNKNSTIEINERANEILLNIGIHNHAHIMVYPSFSENDFNRLIEYTFKLGVAHPIFPILTPLCGTNLSIELQDRITIREHQYYDLAHPVFDLKTSEEVKKFYNNLFRIYYKNYSYKRWIVCQTKKLLNLVTRRKMYSKAQINAPELYSIPFARGWIKRQSKRIESFINFIENSS